MAHTEKCRGCMFENACDYIHCRGEKVNVPQTNADRIRAMSDEELAEFLCGVFDEDECNGKYICGITIPDYDEYRIAEWLKSEVKE